jgi:sugar lactone lactonase YvrE
VRQRLALTAIAAAALALLGGTAANAAPGPGNAPAHSSAFPTVISLPNGFRPEGLATGRGVNFYAGSQVDGAIYRGSLLTGRGAVFIPGTPGDTVRGLKVSGDRLFAAGGPSGTVKVYDVRTGRLLLRDQVGAPGANFVNDVVVTTSAAYFTDSTAQVMYVLPFGPGGRLGPVRTVPLTGDIMYAAGFNANGIVASSDGRTLVLVQSNTGLLFAVSARTGVTRQIDIGGFSVTNGDGLLLRGNTLFVMRNVNNQLVRIALNRGFTAGRVTATITDPDFDAPTTMAFFGPFVYVVNARLTSTPTPDTTYTVVRVS